MSEVADSIERLARFRREFGSSGGTPGALRPGTQGAFATAPTLNFGDRGSCSETKSHSAGTSTLDSASRRSAVVQLGRGPLAGEFICVG